MGDDFGVSLGGELVPFLAQLFLQAEIVFDDAVMHDHNFSGAITVRMGIFFGRTTVRGPARVANAVSAIQRLQSNDFFQIAQLAFGTAQLQPVPVASHSDSRRIVSAVFQPAQALNDDGNYTFLAHIPDDATHRKTSGN